MLPPGEVYGQPPRGKGLLQVHPHHVRAVRQVLTEQTVQGSGSSSPSERLLAHTCFHRLPWYCNMSTCLTQILVFSVRSQESGELEVDSLVATGPARPFASIILRGDVLVEVHRRISTATCDMLSIFLTTPRQVDGIAIQNLEHAEIGRLIIGPAGILFVIFL